MSKDYELTTSPGVSPVVMRASATLAMAGNVGFWVQIVLGVVAALILLFASASLLGGTEGANAVQDPRFNQGSAFGIFCAAGGIVALVISIFFFFRYKTIARLMMVSDNNLRPKKAYTLQTIKFGLLANLIGMMLAIIGAESFIGLVIGKALTIPQGAVFSNTSQLIQPKDLFIILANTHTIASHFTGIVIALWLLNRISSK